MELRFPQILPVQRALAAHVVCAPAALLLAPSLGLGHDWPWLEGLLAAATGAALGLAPWWAIINLCFAPALNAAQSLALSPWWWLAAFVLLMLVYWSTFRTQVPLYLSNAKDLRALANLLPQRRHFRFADLGCGVGSVLRGLTLLRANGEYHGMETAPLPCLLAWWRIKRMQGRAERCSVHWRDFWKDDFSQYDVVYAFLSPAPMLRLWEKASREMRPGTLLISNRFIVPDIAPDQTVPTGEPGVNLYVWRIKAS